MRKSARVTGLPTQVSGEASTLKGLLEWGQQEKEKVLGMLKVLSPDMEEYNQLAERLDKLETTIRQTMQQIANKREGH